MATQQPQTDLEEGLPLLNRRLKDSGSEKTPDAILRSPKGAEDKIIIKIKTTDDGKEHKVEASLSMTIRELKDRVQKQIGAEGKYLRLIASGKMLTPDTALLNTFKVADQSFIHCVLSTTRPVATNPAPQPIESDEEEDDDPTLRRGFDRLRNDGMTRAEIITLRSYFSEQVRSFLRSPSNNSTRAQNDSQNTSDSSSVQVVETDWDRQLGAEEAWMAAQTMSSEFALNTAMQAQIETARGSNNYQVTPIWETEDELNGPHLGTSRDFVLGFIMGSLLGFIMLFWLWESSVPQKQKFGIVTGVIVNLGIRYFRSIVSPDE